MDPHPPLRRRPTARVLLLDPDDRLLLLRTWPRGTREPDWWYVPGGGVEGDETLEEAALREVREETGQVRATLVRPVWTRERPVPARRAVFVETYFLGRSAAFDPRPIDPDWHERQVHFRFRWWRLDDLTVAPDRFDPCQIRTLGPDLLRSVGDGPIPLASLPMA